MVPCRCGVAREAEYKSKPQRFLLSAKIKHILQAHRYSRIASFIPSFIHLAYLPHPSLTMTESKDWHADPITRDSNDSSQPALGAATPWQPGPFRPSEGNIAIPRAVLEKIYLSPPTNVTGDFRNMMANPTPLGLVGFLVATLPTSFALMGLAGAGGGGVATSGLSMWFGGVLQLIACSMEYFLGNTFSFLVFGTFGKWNETEDSVRGIGWLTWG